MKNLHKVKFICLISSLKSESGVLWTNSKWSRTLTKNENELRQKVKIFDRNYIKGEEA